MAAVPAHKLIKAKKIMTISACNIAQKSMSVYLINSLSIEIRTASKITITISRTSQMEAGILISI